MMVVTEDLRIVQIVKNIVTYIQVTNPIIARLEAVIKATLILVLFANT